VDAHHVGLIHRDIKPSNVLLHRSGENDIFAYLCDLGITATNDENRTRSAGVIGTLGYMAPERHEGADASVATDVYSLGCLLWAALTGKPPYEGSDVLMAIQHIRNPIPTYPGEGSLPELTNAILQHSMAKKPADRYTSAAAVREDLLRAVQLATSYPTVPSRARSEEVSRDQPPDTLEYADRPATADPGRSMKARHPTLLLLGLLLLGLAALVGIVALGGVSLRTLMDETITCADGTEVGSLDECQARASSTPSRSASGAPVTCWNGEETARRGQCTTPRGVAGLKWVYPSFERDFNGCQAVPDPTPAEKVSAWFCPFAGHPQEGVRYNEWSSASDAEAWHELHYRSYDPEPLHMGSRRVGDLWRRLKSDENGLFTATAVYQDWPFSTSVQSRTSVGVDTGCPRVVLRSPVSFVASSPSCRR